MVDFKVVISTKDGKSVQREVKEPESAVFLGKKIGEVIKGEPINLLGYELQITGGSDYCGFPMRKDVPGTGRKRILAVSGVGLRKKGKGQRQRKTVCGNTIHAKISQINLKVVKEGKEKLGGEPEKKEEKSKEVKAEEKKPKQEERKEETPEQQGKTEGKKPEDTPKEEVKEEQRTQQPKAEETKAENK
jgi:small subunit ribosomal protein S6e